jgi:hypothetical protein
MSKTGASVAKDLSADEAADANDKPVSTSKEHFRAS